MEERGQFRLSTGVDVHRTPNDDRGDRESPDQSARDIPNTLRQQFLTWGRNPLLPINSINGLEIQQGFKRRHDRQGQPGRIDCRIHPL